MDFKFRQTGVVTILAFLMAGCEAVDDAVTKAANDKEQTSGVSQTSAAGTTPATGTTATSAISTANETAHGLNLATAEVQGGFDFRSAQPTVNLTGCSISGSRVTLSWEAHATWPGSDGSCDAVACAVWKSGGGWTGGYFDYVPQGVTSYSWSLENIVDGYGGPGSGAEVGFFVMARGETERSTVLFTTWP